MKLSSVLLAITAATSAYAADPYYERGWDFEGGANDLGNAPGKNIEDCFIQCVHGPGSAFRPNKCRAVSYWNGNCYFKAKRGEVVYKPDVNSTAVYDQRQPDYPPTQPNTDYVDNDLTNVKADLKDCPKLCQGYKDCRAYSWQTGVCYLKKKRGQVISKQDVTSGLAFPETYDSPKPFDVLFDTDFVDHDIGNKPGKSADDCVDLCKKFPGCHAFSWSVYYGTGTCWLKAKGVQTAYKQGVVSKLVEPGPRILVDVDFVGPNLGVFPANDVATCQAACEKNSACKFFTYRNKFCYLKATVGTVTYGVQGATSGVLKPTTPECVGGITRDVDISNLDIGNRVGIINYDDCTELCQATDGCNAYSWSNYMGGTCWLKQSKDKAQKDVVTHPVVNTHSCKNVKAPWA